MLRYASVPRDSCRGKARQLAALDRCTRWLLACAVALSARLAAAQATAPALTSIDPPGVRRGQTARIVVAGANLNDRARIVLPISFVQALVPPADGKANPARAEFKLLIDPRTPAAFYPVWIETDQGISNPLYFVVGAFAEQPEIEDNNTIEKAQRIELSVTVNGQVPGGDLDYFRFYGRRGDRIVVEALAARLGSGADPSLRLITPSGRLVAYADDTPGLGVDARLVATLPADGDYVVEVHDARFRSGGNPLYRLLVGNYAVPDEVYPLGGRQGETVQFQLRGGSFDRPITIPFGLPVLDVTDIAHLNPEPALASPAAALSLRVGNSPEVLERDALPADANAVAAGETTNRPPQPVPAAPVVINGRINQPGEVDRFGLPVEPGRKYLIDVWAARLGSQLDGHLTLRAPDGRTLAVADDSNLPAPAPGLVPITLADPRVEFQAPPGLAQVVLELRDLNRRGGIGYAYRIEVERSAGDFQLLLPDTRLNIPRGGTTALALTVARTGYNGPIELRAQGLPAGVALHGGRVATGQAQGVLTLTATDAAVPGTFFLQVAGTGRDGDLQLDRIAQARAVLAQQVNVAVSTIELRALACGFTAPSAVRLETPPSPVTILHGHSATVPCKLVRDAAATAAATIAPLPVPGNPQANTLPPGITAQNGAIAENAVDGTVSLAAAVDAPLGQATVVLEVVTKVGMTEVRAAAPALALEVVRPLAIEGVPAELPVTVGKEAKLSGKVVRRPPFAGAVQVRLAGLPNGASAQPVDVPGDQSSFEVVIQAAGGTAVGSVPVRLIAATKLGDKSYELPPVVVMLKVAAP